MSQNRLITAKLIQPPPPLNKKSIPQTTENFEPLTKCQMPKKKLSWHLTLFSDFSPPIIKRVAIVQKIKKFIIPEHKRTLDGLAQAKGNQCLMFVFH